MSTRRTRSRQVLEQSVKSGSSAAECEKVISECEMKQRSSVASKLKRRKQSSPTRPPKECTPPGLHSTVNMETAASTYFEPTAAAEGTKTSRRRLSRSVKKTSEVEPLTNIEPLENIIAVNDSVKCGSRKVQKKTGQVEKNLTVETTLKVKEVTDLDVDTAKSSSVTAGRKKASKRAPNSQEKPQKRQPGYKETKNASEATSNLSKTSEYFQPDIKVDKVVAGCRRSRKAGSKLIQSETVNDEDEVAQQPGKGPGSWKCKKVLSGLDENDNKKKEGQKKGDGGDLSSAADVTEPIVKGADKNRNIVVSGESSNQHATGAGDSSDSEESEWEDVEDLPVDRTSSSDAETQMKKSQRPEKTVQITLEAPIDYANRKRKKGNYDMKEAFRLLLNQFRKQSQKNVHKTHLLCLVAHGQVRNRVCSDEHLAGLVLSLCPTEFVMLSLDSWRIETLSRFVDWFRQLITVDRSISKINLDTLTNLKTCAESKKVSSDHEQILLFVTACRAIGLHTRLIFSLRPVTFKPTDLIPKNGDKKAKMADSDQASVSATSDQVVKTESEVKSEVKMEIEVELKAKASVRKSPAPTKTSVVQKSSATKRKTIVKPREKPFVIADDESDDNSDGDPMTEDDAEEKLGDDDSGDFEKPKTSRRRSCTLRNKYSEGSGTDEDLSELEKDGNGKIEGKGKGKKTTAAAGKKRPSATGSSTVKRKKRAASRKSQDINTSDEDFEPSEESECETPQKKRRAKSETTRRRKTSSANVARRSSQADSSGDDFESDDISEAEDKPTQKRVSTTSSTRKSASGPRRKTARKLMADTDKLVPTDSVTGSDWWAEVFLEAESRWIAVSSTRGIVDSVNRITSFATQPLSHVLAFDSGNTVKDISKKYISDWSTCLKTLRVDEQWWQTLLEPYQPPKDCHRNAVEDQHVEEMLYKKPLPTTIGEYKNNAMYALQRHLLKFEAIYPPSAVPVGFIRGEAVYARECVHTLHARDKWILEGRLVRVGEEPYKIVKARPKFNKPKEFNDNLKLFLYGIWQTEEYVPPPVVNGKLPLNDYGNVEIFKPWMLPSGAAHLKDMPGLNKVARKLDIPCAQAMVGWDFHGGCNHPVFDGWVVCDEHVEVLVAAWEEEQAIIRQKEAEKRQQRVYDNWRLLLRGLLIKQRLKEKFAFQDPTTSPSKKKSPLGSTKEKGKKGKAGKKTETSVARDAETGETSEVESEETDVTDHSLYFPQNRESQLRGKRVDRSRLLPFEKQN